jgi:transposase
MARQSGRWTGRAFIRGGRGEIRQALYMPALVAARFNPDLKAKYKKLASAGKPAKVALTAVMRKLIVLANALLKAYRNWTQNTVDQNGYSRKPASAHRSAERPETRTTRRAAPARF